MPSQPSVAVKPVLVPVSVVVVSTRVEVADVDAPTMRADVVLLPGSSGQGRSVVVKSQAYPVEVSENMEKREKSDQR